MRLFPYAVLFTAGLVAIFSKTNAQQAEFVENKGQWHQNVQFSSPIASGVFYIEHTGFKILLNNPDDMERVGEYFSGHPQSGSTITQPLATADKFAIHSHAYQVNFRGALPQVTLKSEPLKNTYNNYFIDNDHSKWAAGCNIYSEVVYANIYPGIDVRYHTGNGSIKYDFLVHPGADPSLIIMDIDGADQLAIDGDKLIIKTSVGDVTEQKPFTYQEGGAGNLGIDCAFQLTGNSVRFKLAGYDKSKMLVIDPEIVFSSFTGSASDNWAYGATNDSQGNLYAGGIVFGNSYPVTVGAFQTTWAGGGNTGENGGFDIAIMKFNATGTQRLFATYLGASAGNELPEAMLADAQDNLILVGRTTANNYPATQSTIGVGGGWDIVVTKMSADGTSLIGSRRIGGSDNDGVNIKHKYSPNPGPSSLQRNYGEDARAEIATDATGNIYIANCTQSANFPVTAGVFQPLKSVLQDALIMKFDPMFSNLLFASFLGGSGDDAAYSLSLDANGDIVAGGGTTSTDFPGDKSGTVGSSFSGGLADGFIARISNNGSQLKKTVYIGTTGIDQLYCLQVDVAGAIYAVGTSTGNFPVQNAAFSQPGGKQFIFKLQPGFGSYFYSTVFGTNSVYPNIVPTAFLADPCGNVYVSGWGGVVIETSPPFPNAGTTGLSVTPNATQATTDGRDFYTFVLAKDATSQLFGSFFGQDAPDRLADHMDGAKNRFDREGTLYLGICANCQGGAFPVTPGVVGPTNPSGRCNEAAVKIRLNLSVCALPLKWLNFSGLYANNAAGLFWQTAQEQNTDYFGIERSTDGVNFINAGKIAASSSGGGSYQFTDKYATEGVVYYRIKQVDRDGQLSYSTIIKLQVKISKAKGLYVLPNPVKDILNLGYPLLVAKSRISIVNSAGIVVKEKILTVAGTACSIDVHELPAGVYFVYIHGVNGMEKKKFLKL